MKASSVAESGPIGRLRRWLTALHVPGTTTIAACFGLALLVSGPLTAVGCGPADAFTVVPSLQPVDPARDYVRFSLIEGEACGGDAVRGALRDMARLEVDGYLEVVIEVSGRGDDRCATASGHPFRYGTDTTTPAFRSDPNTDPVLVPGRAHNADQPGVDCQLECRRALPLTGVEGDIALELAIDDCVQRCLGPDPSFAQCIAEAVEASAVEACLAIEEDTE